MSGPCAAGGSRRQPPTHLALTFLGTLLVNIDRERDALAALEAALEMAERIGLPLRAVIRIFRGRASMQLGEPPGLVEAAAAWSSPARRPTTRAS